MGWTPPKFNIFEHHLKPSRKCRFFRKQSSPNTSSTRRRNASIRNGTCSPRISRTPPSRKISAMPKRNNTRKAFARPLCQHSGLYPQSRGWLQPHHRIQNVKDSRKADAAILLKGEVRGIIELKGTNITDLTRIEEQAFSYKNNQPECKYVITSNFEKLRFYIDNAIEHIEWDLFALTRNDFELFYGCLAFENLEADIPAKIKAESLSEEDAVTKNCIKIIPLSSVSFFKTWSKTTRNTIRWSFSNAHKNCSTACSFCILVKTVACCRQIPFAKFLRNGSNCRSLMNMCRCTIAS